jgi:hypothetical protein
VVLRLLCVYFLAAVFRQHNPAKEENGGQKGEKQRLGYFLPILYYDSFAVHAQVA